MAPLNLLIEGWRSIHHSYALVAQAHALCLLRRDAILRFRDVPYHDPGWQPTRGLFTAEEEARIAAIPAPEAAFVPAVTWSLRPERPDLSAPAAGRRFAFGTPEHRVLPPPEVLGFRDATEVSPRVEIVTPSAWTATAFARFGFPGERIHVVPHGIDPTIVHPDQASRAAIRAALGVGDEFVFMSIGAMTANKGIALLLAAFGEVAAAAPHVRLVLKGADALYPSKELLKAALDTLPADRREAVVDRMIYHGSTFSARRMAAFMRAADCYVAPYFAEGFNMPVLEAAGSGVAVICTAGGPTDDFTDTSFCTRVRSTVISVPVDHGRTGEALQPDYEHLVEAMRAAARDPLLACQRGAAGARYVGQRYTWDRVTDTLLAAFGKR